MNIIEKRIDEIIPYEKNPRRNDKAVTYVVNSIKQFGFKVPLVIDKDNVIVCGHTRWKAAKRLKMQTLPCVIADDLTDEQIRAFRLADNKVAEIADWDVPMLNFELGELRDFFDFSDFGFDAPVNADEFGDDFSLPDGDKPEFVTMTLHLHKNQKDFIDGVIDKVKNEVSETFGNTNINGNAIFEVCKQWAEQKR